MARRRSRIRRTRARADRRVVLVSITSAGRQVVDQATERRRALIAVILSRIPVRQQPSVAAAMKAFAAASGEIPDSQWPAPDGQLTGTGDVSDGPAGHVAEGQS